MRLRAINQAEDNESVKMLNNFRKHCMFDHGFESSMKAHFLLQMLPAEFGLQQKNKKERQENVGWQVPAPLASFPAHSQDGHIVSLNKSNGWHCDKKASVVFRFTESARLCSIIPRSPHAAASRELQSCLLYCWVATVSLVFWLQAEKNKARSIDYFALSFYTKGSPSSARSNSLTYIETKDSCWVETGPYLYYIKNEHLSTG